MSRKQWGHGFNAGYKARIRDEHIKEVLAIMDENKEAHIVPVVGWGSEGCEADQKYAKYLCYQYQGEGSPSCVSGSGGSQCMCFMGHINENEILCLGEMPKPSLKGF